MPKKEIIGSGPPGLPFPEAVLAGDTLYLSGMIGIDFEKQALAEGGIGPETKQAIHNLKGTLEKADLSLHHVVKVTAYIRSMDEFQAFNDAYVECFQGVDYPARETVAVAGLALGACIELSFIAVRD